MTTPQRRALPPRSRPAWTSSPSWSSGGQAVRQRVYSVTSAELRLNAWQKRRKHGALKELGRPRTWKASLQRILQGQKEPENVSGYRKEHQILEQDKEHYETYRRVGHTQYNYISKQEISSNHTTTTGLFCRGAWSQQIQRCRPILPQRTWVNFRWGETRFS